MTKVYITNASLNLISKSLKNKLKYLTRDNLVTDIADDFDNDILTPETLNEFFNTEQLKDFYFRKYILKDFKSLLLTIVHENKNMITDYIKSQNKQYAFEIKQPAYHQNQSCGWMQKSFSNIEIPYECMKGEAMLEEAKSWVKKNEQNLKVDFTKYNNIFKHIFNCIEGLKDIKLKNSGNIIFQNEKLSDFVDKKELTKKSKQLRFYYDTEHAKKIKNYRYAPNYRINTILITEEDIDAKKAIIDFHTIKDDIKHIIFREYQRKYNNDLSFDKTILDSIGFKKCNGCNR